MTRMSPPSLPETLHFEDMGRCFYILGLYRKPVRGDFYVVDSQTPTHTHRAHRARADLAGVYWIVSPTHYALPAPGYVKGAMVNMPPMET